MAYGGPAQDLLETRRGNSINAGTLDWPLATEVWDRALHKGRGRGPIRHLRILADRLHWVPAEGGWLCED
eukprot:327750-Amphidinium_carterae.1